MNVPKCHIHTLFDTQNIIADKRNIIHHHSDCHDERDFGENQQPDGSDSLSPLYSIISNFLYVNVDWSLHQNFCWRHIDQKIVHRLSGYSAPATELTNKLWFNATAKRSSFNTLSL